MTSHKIKIYIGIPAYNAQDTIADIIRRTNRLGFVDKIIIVNDCSTDKTAEAIRKFRSIILINHKKNVGYGGAQKTIFKKFLELSNRPDDIIIMLHSDGQTLPEEVPILKRAFNNKKVDIVLGSRALGNMRKGNMPIYKIMGDSILTIIQNIGFGLNLSTYASGFRGFCRRALENIVFEDLNNKHSFDTEIIVRALEKKLNMVEVPVTTIYEGKESNYNIIKYSTQVTSFAMFYLIKRMFTSDTKNNSDYKKNKDYWINAKHDWYFARKKGNIFERLFLNFKGNFILSKIDYRNKVVLDCGCGTSVYTQDIAKKSKTTIGLDISHWALKKANKRKDDNNVFYVVADSEKLPFKDGSFDVVVNTAVFQYYHDSKQMIKEIGRVLKHQGIVLSEVPYKYGFYSFKSFIKLLTSKKDFAHEPINRCYSKKEFKKIFSKFKLVKIYDFYNILLFGIFQRR